MPHPRQVQVIQRQTSTNVVPGVGNTANYPHITNSRHHTNASPNPQAAHNRSMRTERCVSYSYPNSQQTSQNIMVKFPEIFPPIVHGMEAYYTNDYVEMVINSRIN